MESLISQGIGICGCVIVFSAVYYGNVWEAKRFPFLSQEIFQGNSTAGNYTTWNQNFVIGSDNRIDKAKLDIIGLPWLATTYAVNILVTNMATAAAVTHICLFYWNDVKASFAWAKPSNLRKAVDPRTWSTSFYKNSSTPDKDQPHYDPHYKLMLAYKTAPDWWYLVVLGISFVIAMAIIYTGNSTMPWWQLIVAMIIGYLFLIFFGAMQAITGVGFLVQPIIQMLGGYMRPGNPVANMYFSLYVSRA